MTLFPGHQSSADLTNGSVDASFTIAFLVSIAAFVLLVGLLTSQVVKEYQKKEGWIPTDKNLKEGALLDIPFLSVTNVKVKEDGYIYASPGWEKPIGYVHADEIFVVEGEKTNEWGSWYKIKFNSDNLISSESSKMENRTEEYKMKNYIPTLEIQDAVKKYQEKLQHKD